MMFFEDFHEAFLQASISRFGLAPEAPDDLIQDYYSNGYTAEEAAEEYGRDAGMPPIADSYNLFD